MNTSSHIHMTIRSATAMNTATAMPGRNPAVSAYWKSVKLCVAKPDGSAVIHHLDGRVERIGTDGRFKRDQKKVTDSVTKKSPRVTHSYLKEVMTMED